MPTTLTLQLVFDPSNTSYTPYGRFLPDPGSSAPITQRSKVWILNTGNGNPVVSPDNPGTPIAISKQQGVQVQINIIASLPAGYSWGPDPYPIKVGVVFGRAHHPSRRNQDYASPFALANVTPPTVCAIFEQWFTAAQLGTAYDALVPLGAPAFLDTTVGSKDIYDFNVGVTVSLTHNGQPLTLSFGHDPDMQVDQ